MRGKILELIVFAGSKIERLRIVQTIEIMEHFSPFSVAKYPGDADADCTKLRRWINSVQDISTISDEKLLARTCPFPCELPFRGDVL